MYTFYSNMSTCVNCLNVPKSLCFDDGEEPLGIIVKNTNIEYTILIGAQVYFPFLDRQSIPTYEITSLYIHAHSVVIYFPV